MKIKRCPFCGGEATTFAGGIDMYGSLMYGVMCKNTACCMIPSKYPSKEAAIEVWNRREPINNIVEQLEAEIESSDKYIAEYDDSEVQKVWNAGMRKCLEIVKGGAE